MLKHRLITASILIPIVIAALFLLSPTMFSIAIIIVCMLSAWEWGQFIGINSCSHRIWFAIICGLLLMLMVFTIPTDQPFITVWQVRYTLKSALVWWPVALLLVLYYPRSATLWYKSQLLQLVFGMLTILPFFWGMLTLRQCHFKINYFTGAWLLLYIMIIVWSIDCGAYIFGRTFGNYKLAPLVSPDKTWEGLVGGLVTSIITAWLFSKQAPFSVKPLILIICSVFAALASVLGDLTESMFKREFSIKHSSNLIPGHGGVLDRIDSLTAAVPVFACLILLIFNAI